MDILTDLHKKLTEEMGQDAAGRVVDLIRHTYGGETFYIPRRPPFRAETIRGAVATMGVKAAAKACGITPRRAYQVLHSMRTGKQ